MNFLRNPFSASLSGLRRLTGGGGGIVGNPLKTWTPCVCGEGNNELNLNSKTGSPLTTAIFRFYGTWRTVGGAVGGSFPSMGSFLLAPRLNQPMSINTAVLTGGAGGDLSPGGLFTLQSRGMKYRGKVHRRCRDCKLVWVNGQLYNLCSTHKRHKHGLRYPFFANMRILTHATMSPKRPW